MKIQLAFFLMLYCCMRSSAQMSEFAPIGASWWYNNFKETSLGYTVVEAVDDTIINSHTYRVLDEVYHHIDFSESGFPVVEEHQTYEYIRQSDSIIYYLQGETEYILYDFGAEIGDEWLIGGDGPGAEVDDCDTVGMVQVTQKYDTVVAGFDLKVIKTETIDGSAWTFRNYPILEKFGSLQYVLPDANCVSLFENFKPGPLRCYQDNETSIIKFSETECDHINYYLNISSDDKSVYYIYPSPAYKDIFLEFNTTTAPEVILTEISGTKRSLTFDKMTSNTFSADISFLPPGIYFITILVDKNPIGTQKIIKL